MKKSTLFYSILIVFLSICIVLVILFKFILKPGPGFNIEKRESIRVTDLNGKESGLFSLFNGKEDTYLLIFSFNDCSSCIYRGIEELKTIKKAGRTCIAIVVHDYYEEIKSWSANQDFSPFVVLKRIDFYEHIKTSSTPVLVKIRNGKIKNAFYIFAN
jgi:hypothetical protein